MSSPENNLQFLTENLKTIREKSLADSKSNSVSILKFWQKVSLENAARQKILHERQKKSILDLRLPFLTQQTEIHQFFSFCAPLKALRSRSKFFWSQTSNQKNNFDVTKSGLDIDNSLQDIFFFSRAHFELANSFFAVCFFFCCLRHRNNEIAVLWVSGNALFLHCTKASNAARREKKS